jgi:2-keto-4-pentenoate hydratase/2-oxohepta-3-ene-1,7-dioic acid hydratase in catechol pathway
MQLGKVLDPEGWRDVVAAGDRYLPLPDTGAIATVERIAAAGGDGVERAAAWVVAQPDDAWRPLAGVAEIGAPVDAGAIYTVGLNYRVLGEGLDARPERPLVYGKAAASLAGQDGVLAWDRSLTANVDAECELGVVIGHGAWQVSEVDAMSCVLGYTIVNDVSSRDPWLDGDQWLLGKSMPGFCPTGPWIVTADGLDVSALRLGCTINGETIQNGTTADLRFSIAEIVAYLSHHVFLSPGDLIATGTPARLASAPGPDRHLEAGDVVTVWIEHIGELTTTIG